MLNAQVIRKSEFEGIKWYTDNSINSFYKSDRVSLFRIIDSLPEYSESNRQYRALNYNKNNNVSTLECKRKAN